MDPDDFWSAPAERSGDGALEFGGVSARKAAHRVGGDAPRPSKAVALPPHL